LLLLVFKTIDKKPKINEQIRAAEIRVIDENGQNLGVMPPANALQLAKERNLDLIEIAPQAQPPVCRIMDFGKYLYKKEKEERVARARQKTIEIKGVRFGLKTSAHDMEMKAGQAEKFLNKGNKVKIELVLRGREKANLDFAKERLRGFLRLIHVNFRVEEEVKKNPRGLITVIIKT